MVKEISSKISDPRPRINVVLQSDDEKTEAIINKGYVNIQRGKKKAILRVPYGELGGIIDLAKAAADVLDKNGYDSTSGSDIEANAEPADATDQATPVQGSAEQADVHTAATEGEGAAPLPVTSEDSADAEGAEISYPDQSQADTSDSYKNPFEN